MIETERTYMRPLEREDLAQRAAWFNDPAVRQTLISRFPVSVSETQHWFERVLQDSTRKDFIIVLQEKEEPIGFAGYVNIDWMHRKAESFIAIGAKEHWGKGLGSEVVRKLLDYGFNELGLNRQYALVLDSNPGALRMHLRAGLRQEGILRQDVLIHGAYDDRIMLGITRDEFNADRAKESAAAKNNDREE